MSKFFKSTITIATSFCLFLCACHSRNHVNETSSNIEPTLPPSENSAPIVLEESLDPSSQTDSAPSSIDPPTDSSAMSAQNSDVWDISDVDISAIDPTKKLISFTFDDSPGRTLENIFAVFADFNESNPDCIASATVFFNGYLFDSGTPHLLHAACAMGFELGNHTHSHHDLTTLDDATLRTEIDATDALLKRADGKERHLLRAPFGRVNETVKKAATTPLIDWSIDTLDWTGVSADEIYHSVFDHRYSGAIVLMHDGYAATVDALKRLLPDLKADGYQIVNVSQMIRAHSCIFKRGNVYIQAKKH